MEETALDRRRRLAREKQARYVAKHPDRVKKTQAEYYERNREARQAAAREAAKTREWTPERNAWQNAHRAKNREAQRSYNREYKAKRRKEDPQFAIAERLRTRLCQVRPGAPGSAVRDLGCSLSELIEHLERQFQPGMTWDNRGAWHIDHRRPLASFDLLDRVQLLQACHYTNLQPLWAFDNLSKGSKMVVSG